MRSQQEAALPDLCTIRRVTKVADGYGGQTENEVLNLNRACRLKPLKGQKEVFSGVFAESGDALVTLAHDELIDELDEVEFDGATYEVVNIEDSQSWTTAKRVLVRRVKP